MTKFIFVLLTVILKLVIGKEYVTNVRQNYVDEINNKLTKQIQKELSASYFQRADVSLSGISSFFSGASLEEREHAQSLIDYVNKRGGFIQLDNIDLKGTCETVLEHLKNSSSSGFTGFAERRLCICGFVATKTINNVCEPREFWKEGLMAFEDALAVERYVNEQLLAIHKEADEKNDAHLAYILEHEFLEEQVNSISKLAHYVTRLRSFAQGNNYKLGEYIFDQHIA